MRLPNRISSEYIGIAGWVQYSNAQGIKIILNLGAKEMFVEFKSLFKEFLQKIAVFLEY